MTDYRRIVGTEGRQGALTTVAPDDDEVRNRDGASGKEREDVAAAAAAAFRAARDSPSIDASCARTAGQGDATANIVRAAALSKIIDELREKLSEASPVIKAKLEAEIAELQA